MSAATTAVAQAGWRNVFRRIPGGGLRGLLPLAAVLAYWQLTGSETSTSFPTPNTWWAAMKELSEAGVLWPAVSVTLRTFAYSLVLATILGALLGMLVGASRTVERALTPIMDFFRSLPPPVIVPVASLVIGIGLRSGVIVVTIAIIWPIMLNTAAGMLAVPRVRLEMARTLGVSRTERLFKVIVPSLLPSIMVGVRIAISVSLVVTLVVDILGSGGGLGLLIIESQHNFDARAVWGILVLIGLFGYAVNAGIAIFERRILRNWPEAG